MTWYRTRTDYDNSDPETAADHNEMCGYILTHHYDHEASGNNKIKLDNLAAPDDNTDLDATSSSHGLYPKSNTFTIWLAGTGGYGTVRLATATTPSTFDTSTNYNAYNAVKFPASATDTSWNWTFPLPGNFGGTVTLLCRPYWTTQNTGTTGTIIAGFKGLAINTSRGNIGKALGTEVTSSYTVSAETSNNLFIGADATVTLATNTGYTNAAGYNLVNFRMSRKGYDTFAGDVYCLGVLVKVFLLGPTQWI
jgi:hypothetical protein